MPDRDSRPPAPRRQHLLALTLCAAGLVLGLLAAPSARAAFEWQGPEVGEFPKPSDGVRLSSSPYGLATNNSTGDLYYADGGDERVMRFDKQGRFLEAWGWAVGNGEAKLERCGPDGEPAFTVCQGRDRSERESGLPGEGPGQFEEPRGIAVDQATGDVFVLSENSGIVNEYDATGDFIASFGHRGTASPDQVENTFPGILAIDGEGRVYVVDDGGARLPRVMVFEANLAGEYAYSHDIFAGKFANAESLAIGAEGRFYLAANGKIMRFESAGAAAASWQIKASETEGMTVIPSTGEVIYFDVKARLFRQVKPVGTSEKTETTFHAEQQTHAERTAFDPAQALPGHPPGILYADEEYDSATEKPSRGLIFAPSAKSPPEIAEESTRGVGAGVATLTATIDPKGNARYRFEYGSEGPCSKAACTEAPIGGGELSGTTAQPVSVTLSHLQPETTYSFRLLAENENGRAEGPDRSFETYPPVAARLPDGRAYELVSPADKNGGEVFPASPEVGSCRQCEPGINSIKMPEQSAPDGESIVYEGYAFFPSSEGQRGALKENEYRSLRTSSGWQTTDLSPERQTHGFGFRAFTSDLATAVLQEPEAPLAAGALPEGYEELYRREAGGALVPFILEPGSIPARALDLEYQGGSADLAVGVFEANEPLTQQTPFAPKAPPVAAGERDLYEWNSGGLRLVSVLPGNTTAASGSVVGAGKLLSRSPEYAPATQNAVSRDGSRVFWTELESGRLFIRENGETTREIAHTGRCKLSSALSERVCFLAASEDGSRVLLSNGALYDATTEPAAKLFDVTKGHHGFEGLAGANGELSRIYFVDNEVLNPVRGPLETVAQEGKPNLYEYEAGANAVRFIATLDPADEGHGTDDLTGTWEPSPQDRVAQVADGGRFLAFDTIAPLEPGYDNVQAGGEGCDGKGTSHACSEVYEYDAQARSVTCVSCNPAGLPPVGRSTLSLLQPIVSRFPQPRNLLADGRVFFDSFDTLSAGDQSPGVENVYESERQGQGSCEAAKGCLALISAGRGNLDASFLGAGETGKDVFFTTRQRLLPELDTDELVDLYDAREGGGFQSAAPPVPCAGEACRLSTAAGLTAGPAGSSTFSGPGNPAPGPEDAVKHAAVHVTPRKGCPKGEVRRRVAVRRHGKVRRVLVCVRPRKKGAKKGSASTTRTVRR